jgi:hypothetical protein
MTALAIVLLTLALIAAVVGGIKFGPLGFVAGICVAMASLMAFVLAAAMDAQAVIEAVEDRYDIAVEDRPGENDLDEPGPWLIDGQWRTCALSDVDSKTPTLQCAEPLTDFTEPTDD